MPGEVITDDEWLTHHGTRRADGTEAFRCMLREMPGKREADMSLIRGRLTAEEAGRARLGLSRNPRRDAARHTTAGRLREAGFRVEHTPRLPGSPWHVSVFWDHGIWDADVGKSFEACFGEEG